MKAPLLLFVTLFFICLFSGCEKGKCYYYDLNSCNELKGNVKKVTDTTYQVTDGEITHLLSVKELHIDSLHRLIEQIDSYYDTEVNEEGEVVNVSITSRFVSKYRYDRDGRKVETHNCHYTYISDSERIMSSSMRLVNLKNNIETWEHIYNVPENEKEYFPNVIQYCRYKKNSLELDYEEENLQGVESVVYIFDDRKNMIEASCVIDRMESKVIYKYNEDNLLTESVDCQSGITTYYQYDEFDNEENWMKMTELDEQKEIQCVIRRRIEYRIQ